MLIGEKIKLLRKNKNVTQTQLAEALSVSPQTVSKWETYLSSPDISILPIIARYFGITMDELFNYRLDALNYKERFIRFMVNNGMLRFGEFTLKSGRISPYLIHSGYNRLGSQISKLGDFYAECIKYNNIESNCLIGIEERDIPQVISTCMTLYNKYGVDTMQYVDFEFEASVKMAKNMTIITDAFTSGSSLISTINIVKERFGKYPTDIVVCVDRMEMTESKKMSAKHEIEHKYGVNIHPIVNAEDILNALEKGVIIADDYVEPFRRYLNKYKGK